MRPRPSVRLLSFVLALVASLMLAGAVRSARGQERAQGFTAETDAEALRLIRNDKLDLILPGAMRDNGVDMWIHVTRAGGIWAHGSGDLMTQHFGNTNGYLIFTDRGDRIERAVFGDPGAVENIDVHGSRRVAQALDNYNYDNYDPYDVFDFEAPGVFDEIRQFIAERDPQVIAVNTSKWLPVADGISHSSYERLVQILGPEYSSRLVSAENVILDFISRRTAREVAAQAHTLAVARQITLGRIRSIVPGQTTIGDVRGRIYYTVEGERKAPPDIRWWINDPSHVYRPGDFFATGAGYEHMGFGVDTKVHVYILRDGETEPPEFIQRVWDLGKRAQAIMRPHVRVGMTARESMDAMVAALEAEGFIHTPFVDIGVEDYRIAQRMLADTDRPGIYLDLHAFGNSGDYGPSISAFRPDTLHLKFPLNHIFAFEYAVHANIAERPGYPMSINFSNPQVVTPLGVEWIQPPNDEIVLIR